MRNTTVVRLTAVMAMAVALGAGWSGMRTAHADASVTIAGFAFSPASVTINVGEAVTWTNNDGAPHSVAFSGGPTGPTMNQGQTYSRTFEAAGTYAYQCGIHPSMAGSVTVAGAQEPTATATSVPPTNTTAPSTATPTSTVTPTATPTPASGGGEDPTATATPPAGSTETPTPSGETPTPADQTPPPTTSGDGTATPAATGTPPGGDTGDDDGGSNTGLFVGVVVAVLAGLVLAAAGVVMRRRAA